MGCFVKAISMLGDGRRPGLPTRLDGLYVASVTTGLGDDMDELLSEYGIDERS